MKKYIHYVACTVLWPAIALGNPWKLGEARDYYEKENYRAAIPLFLELAQAGNPTAMAYLQRLSQHELSAPQKRAFEALSGVQELTPQTPPFLQVTLSTVLQSAYSAHIGGFTFEGRWINRLQKFQNNGCGRLSYWALQIQKSLSLSAPLSALGILAEGIARGDVSRDTLQAYKEVYTQIMNAPDGPDQLDRKLRHPENHKILEPEAWFGMKVYQKFLAWCESQGEEQAVEALPSIFRTVWAEEDCKNNPEISHLQFQILENGALLGDGPSIDGLGNLDVPLCSLLQPEEVEKRRNFWLHWGTCWNRFDCQLMHAKQLAHQNQFQKAGKILETLIRLDQVSPIPYFNLANLLLTGKYPLQAQEGESVSQAITLLEEAKKRLQADSPPLLAENIFTHLAYAHLWQGEYDQAWSYLSAVSTPDFLPLYFTQFFKGLEQRVEELKESPGADAQALSEFLTTHAAEITAYASQNPETQTDLPHLIHPALAWLEMRMGRLTDDQVLIQTGLHRLQAYIERPDWQRTYHLIRAQGEVLGLFALDSPSEKFEKWLSYFPNMRREEAPSVHMMHSLLLRAKALHLAVQKEKEKEALETLIHSFFGKSIDNVLQMKEREILKTLKSTDEEILQVLQLAFFHLSLFYRQEGEAEPLNSPARKNAEKCLKLSGEMGFSIAYVVLGEQIQNKIPSASPTEAKRLRAEAIQFYEKGLTADANLFEVPAEAFLQLGRLLVQSIKDLSKPSEKKERREAALSRFIQAQERGCDALEALLQRCALLVELREAPSPLGKAERRDSTTQAVEPDAFEELKAYVTEVDQALVLEAAPSSEEAAPSPEASPEAPPEEIDVSPTEMEELQRQWAEDRAQKKAARSPTRAPALAAPMDAPSSPARHPSPRLQWLIDELHKGALTRESLSTLLGRLEQEVPSEERKAIDWFSLHSHSVHSGRRKRDQTAQLRGRQKSLREALQADGWSTDSYGASGSGIGRT